ncbi:MAG: hypothetical protein V4463_03275 [Pseudomonadota bacterium]
MNSAQCRCRLADGSTLLVTATRRARANRADVKGTGPLAERIAEVVRLARHTENLFDSRDQVVLSMDGLPAAHDRSWELAAVLADRMVRGVHRHDGDAPVCGWSDAWHLGQLQGAQGIGHLGALTGHADPAGAVSSARAWFPLYSGGAADALCAVEVSVHPFAGSAASEEETIDVPGVDMVRQDAVRQVLAAARHFDGRALGRWRSVVRFEQARFQGNSFELALVMADRIARGREFQARGRIIASGCSAAWHAGQVDTVEGCAPKSVLILQHALAGDRILLPKAWREQLGEEFAIAVRQKGASLACIDRIGII